MGRFLHLNCSLLILCSIPLLFSCGPRVLLQAAVEGAGEGADRSPPQADRSPQPGRGQDSLAQKRQPNDGILYKYFSFPICVPRTIVIFCNQLIAKWDNSLIGDSLVTFDAPWIFTFILAEDSGS